MPQGVITALEVQKRDKQRVNIYLDGEYAFSLSLIEAAKLHKGQVLSEELIAELRDEDTILRAVDTAAHFLGYRPRSMAEVRQNLADKGFSPSVIETALGRLVERGYVDDLAFARYWVQNRSTFRPRSQQALRYELRQKGVTEDHIQAALTDLDELSLAYEVARQRASRLRHPTREDFRKKLGGLLQRRGFSFTTVRETLDRLADELVEDDPDYFAEINDE
ncbi:MAG: RecX family transcriptional regulator [Anaerolineaceae bacterium]|nr:RecX family transcriptional regulator [Anaerolineaceae bacterium]